MVPWSGPVWRTALRGLSIPDSLLNIPEYILIISPCIDILNDDGRAIEGYDYLIDLTCTDALAKQKTPRIAADAVTAALRESLPCYVDGGLHFTVNECTEGGHYLAIFNHSGIYRTVAEGERILPKASKEAKITFKNECDPKIVFGDGALVQDGEGYSITLPGGGFALIHF